MREVKFRVWDKIDERMIVDEQDYIPLKITNKGVLRLNPNYKENFWEFIEGERFELMQYTGMKDKKEKEIYEGDLIKNKRGTVSVVIYHNYGFCLDSGFLKMPLFKFNSYDELEVIGNIYKDGVIYE